MKKIKIEIETINNAFHPTVEIEVVRILKDIINRIEQDGNIQDRKIMDFNGNSVGNLKTH